MLYTEIKDKISKNILVVPVNKRLELAALAAFIEYGSFEEHKAYKVRSLMLPRSLNQEENEDNYGHELFARQVEYVINNWREISKKASISPSDQVDTMRLYLEVASSISLFGMTYIEIVDREKTKLWLGFGGKQLVITPRDNMLDVMSVYTWDKIEVNQKGGIKWNKSKRETVKYVVEGSKDHCKYIGKYIMSYKQLVKIHEPRELVKANNIIVLAQQKIKNLEDAEKKQNHIREEKIKMHAEQARARAKQRARHMEEALNA